MKTLIYINNITFKGLYDVESHLLFNSLLQQYTNDIVCTYKVHKITSVQQFNLIYLIR